MHNFRTVAIGFFIQGHNWTKGKKEENTNFEERTGENEVI